MEASSVKVRRLRDPELALTPGARLARGFATPVKSGLGVAGDLGLFARDAFAELGRVWRYAAEILRQMGTLIVGSMLITCLMVFLMGMVCGTEADYVLRGYGASVYSGVFSSYCMVREMIPYMFGYIFTAKVGCGLAAEIGSMRIQNELDALEAIGINPMRYVIAPRLVAGIAVLPFFWILATASGFLAVYLVIVVQLGDVSAGGWSHVNWAFSTPIDFFYSWLKVMVAGTMILIVGMYYGYRATGGPVGVGTATAKSTILNLVLLHVVLGGMTVLFWGLNPNAPIGG
jgi:phospholipid/cholesterol/gamma-HCH transport system permease protein